MYRINNNGVGYDVKNGSTTLTSLGLPFTQVPDYQQLTFVTELSVSAAGSVNIDLVPNTAYDGFAQPNLMWIFIPN